MKTKILPNILRLFQTRNHRKKLCGERKEIIVNPFIQLRKTTPIFLVTLVCFSLSPTARATCREGCLTGDNTVLGDDALLRNTGGGNTATGFKALSSNTTGGANTATGWQALFNNTTSTYNTAVGYVALQNNTTGTQNTGVGVSALRHNIQGSFNTATGVNALYNNTTISGNSGTNNTANGVSALFNNTTGDNNIAIGNNALVNNTTASANTAIGVNALHDNRIGVDNVAIGNGALQMNNHFLGSSTAVGFGALFQATGNNNIALGSGAGNLITFGGGNIHIGNSGSANDEVTIRIGDLTQTRTFIAGISGVAVTGSQVVVNSSGQLGVTASSARFKETIKPMDKASEAIHALRPVTFRYKKELDPERIPQFGLVAEEVAKVNPDLVVRDENGEIYTVRYEAVNAMLLNELLKEHRKVQKQEATITQLKKDLQATAAHQQRQIESLTAGLQKVSAQIQLSKPAPQTVLNNR
jgi:trimeric autotransporter adhesin